jgi:hypothetical protein
VLRITPDIASGAATLSLEGKVAGPWVDVLERCWRDLRGNNGAPVPVKVNLHEVSFLDVRGKDLLSRMEREGASLVDCSAFIRQLLESKGTARKEHHGKTTRRKD